METKVQLKELTDGSTVYDVHLITEQATIVLSAIDLAHAYRIKHMLDKVLEVEVRVEA